MDDFLMSSRYVSPIQQDVIVGGPEQEPDVNHYVTEEVILSDAYLSGTSDYGSCGENSPVSSDDFFEDILDIKEELIDTTAKEDLSVTFDLTKVKRVSRDDSESFSDSEIVCVDDDSVVVVQGEEPDKEYFNKKNYVYVTENGQTTQTFVDFDDQTVDLPDIYAKPKMTYAMLIAEAMLSSEDRMLTLSGIYTAVANKHRYYKLEASKNWQNAIRHNLTLNRCFTKVSRPTSEGRGSYWKLEKGAEYTIFKKTLGRQLMLEQEKLRTPVTKFDCGNGIVYVTIPENRE